uniref:Uncharacterized protein n=1 Tax=Brassica oleracea var. oleracea TaxID=109376 RepID=A0A0D3D9G5_BRAOL
MELGKEEEERETIEHASLAHGVLYCIQWFVTSCYRRISTLVVIIGRAEDGSEVPQRRHEVAPKHLSERPSWSDPVKSLAIFIPLEAQRDLPRATHRGRSHVTPLSERPPKATP